MEKQVLTVSVKLRKHDLNDGVLSQYLKEKLFLTFLNCIPHLGKKLLILLILNVAGFEPAPLGNRPNHATLHTFYTFPY